jgi:putative protease
MQAIRIKKPELLAPAGKEEVFLAAIEAGADAVYLAGKSFNMRRHRTDFNFTAEAIERSVAFGHARNRKIYVTVNALVGTSELDALRDYLRYLDALGVDALIVQDLGVVALHRSLGLKVPLHASTMMNVGCADAAAFLARHGFTRVVTSRDITLDDVRRIRETAGVEAEYFIHGDMCTAQSGQCFQSGLIFGKSGNRGQCMKPCRWTYDLMSGAAADKPVVTGVHLLAAKDMCLIQQIPELVRAGVDALKIEGRMRPAPFVAELVRLYRNAIDRYCDNPLAPARTLPEIAELHQSRIRNLTTGFAFKAPDAHYMDLDGEREPVFLSYAGTLPTLLASDDTPLGPYLGTGLDGIPEAPVEVTVFAGTRAQADAAVPYADNLVLCWEGDLQSGSHWTLAEIGDLASGCRRAGKRLLLASPRIITEREAREWRLVAETLADDLAGFSVTSIAALEGVRSLGRLLWGEASLNVLNPEALRFLAGEGITRLLPALECGFEDLALLADRGLTPLLELPVQGPLVAMVLEHCLVGMALQGISKREICRMPCAIDTFHLRDARGNVRRICTDNYCRNHILMENDLCLISALPALMSLRPASVRIDARLTDPATLPACLAAYRKALAGDPSGAADYAAAHAGELFNQGAYPKGIIHDVEKPITRFER